MSTLTKLFGFEEGKHNVRTEILAGITTFLTMSYILAVNPNIFGALEDMGMPGGAVFTATALAAIVGTLVMSLYAKKPFALAPGMGLNAFFVFTVCLGMGHTWQFALTAVLIEGLVFILLTLTNVRQAIVNAIPTSLKNAISAGIGLFIAFIGLQNAGVVVNNDSTLVGLNLATPEAILFIIGFILTSILLIFKVKGAMLIGILITAVIGIPMGITKFDGVVSMAPSIKPIFCQFVWSEVFSLDMLIVVFTFLFIDMFDTIGTVIGVSKKANMLNPDGTIPQVNKILMADAVATAAGAAFGTSTTTTYVESASGVAAGGRTGLTSFTVVVLFVVALFFSPIFLAIPSSATSAVLVLVGVMMASSILDIDFIDFSEAIPAYVTFAMMPFAYSISDGIMLGVITYVVLNAISGKLKKISIALWILAVLFVLRYIFL